MSFAPTSPVTGGAQTGFTSPTYTLTTDIAPSVNGKQYAVSGLGGTQTNVETHSTSKPFTVTFMRPASAKAAPLVNPVTGIMKRPPMNVYKYIIRKGVLPAANQSAEVAMVNMSISIPAGADSYEPEDIRAMLSLAIGVLNQQSAGVGDTCVTNIL